MTDTSSRSATRDLWVALGMTLSATSAALSSFDGLRSLALAAGWTVWMGPLLPLTVDAFAATATRVWLADSTGSTRARRFARRCAVGAILLSLAGNAIWHLVDAGLLEMTWLIVLAVGAVPPLVLGLVTHLAVLRRQIDQAEPAGVSEPPITPGDAPTEPAPVEPVVVPPPQPTISYATDDELLAAAAEADTLYRKANNGKPITRDELRQQLHIGAEKASSVLRRLRTEQRRRASEPMTISQHKGS
jgi:hypothetical protein